MLKKINKHNGFTLIEVVVALLIGSILTLSLYQIYNNILKSVIKIGNIIDTDSSYMPLYNQLEKDIMGAFIPVTVLYSSKKDNNKTDNKTDNIFSFSGSDKQFNLNFLTTGGIKKIDSTGSVISDSYVKRVVYKLVSDKDQQDLFILKYGITDNIYSDINKLNLKYYDLANNLKQINFNFKILHDKKIVNLKDFNSQEIFKKYKTYIPAYVQIEGIFLDSKKNNQLPFKFLLPVPGFKIIESESDQNKNKENIENKEKPNNEKEVQDKEKQNIPAKI